MTAFRLKGYRGGVMDDIMYPGDLIIQGETLGNSGLTTAGAGTITGAIFATGFVIRSGQAGATNDTLDTSQNVLTALSGNSPAPDLVPGSTFRFRYINTVAGSVITLVAGTGFSLDSTTVANAVTTVAASSFKDFLVTVLNATPASTVQCATTNASAVVTFILPSGRSSRVIGPNGTTDITPGQVVSGTGITAGTTVIGITLGQGGITGITLSANATATSAAGGVALTFNPALKIGSIGGSVSILT